MRRQAQVRNVPAVALVIRKRAPEILPLLSQKQANLRGGAETTRYLQALKLWLQLLKGQCHVWTAPVLQGLIYVDVDCCRLRSCLRPLCGIKGCWVWETETGSHWSDSTLWVEFSTHDNAV